MICEKCGAENPNGSKFCVNCRNALESFNVGGGLPLAPIVQAGPLRNSVIDKILGTPIFLYAIATAIFILLVVNIIAAFEEYDISRDDYSSLIWHISQVLESFVFNGAVLIGITGLVLAWRRSGMRHVVAIPRVLYGAALIVFISIISYNYFYYYQYGREFEFYNFSISYTIYIWWHAVTYALFRCGILAGIGLLVSSILSNNVIFSNTLVTANAYEAKSSTSELICPVCNNALKKEWKFCPECSEPQNECYCSGCGAVIACEWKVCPYCERPLDEVE